MPLEGARQEGRKLEFSKRKTCNLSIRVTPHELTLLAERAHAEGCLSVSEYTRGILFTPTRLRGYAKEHHVQIAHLEKDLQALRRDVERLQSRLGE